MGKDASTIRQEIEQTRERMGDTVEALAYKTDVPARVKDSVNERIESVKGTIGDVVDSVKSAVVGATDNVKTSVAFAVSRLNAEHGVALYITTARPRLRASTIHRASRSPTENWRYASSD